MALDSNIITGGLGPGGNLAIDGFGGAENAVGLKACLPPKVKSPEAGCQPGYWGRNPHQRVICEQTIHKIRALLQDQLLMAGLKADLWMSVWFPKIEQRRFVGSTQAIPGNIECTCFKKTTKQADRKCKSCYGQRYIPGFLKFGYRTYFTASVDPSINLVNLQLDNSFTPNRLRLIDGQLSGVAESQDYPYDYTGLDAWEFEDTCIVDDVNSSAVTEFSTDSGATWNLLSDIGVVQPQGTGTIRFRVTLQRDSTDVISPYFEILRVRHPMIEYGSRCGPYILILKNIVATTPEHKVHGTTIEQPGKRFWTAPLSLFDPSIPTYSKGELITRNSFVELTDGIEMGERFPILDWTANDPLGYLTRQWFGARLAQENEHLSIVF